MHLPAPEPPPHSLQYWWPAPCLHRRTQPSRLQLFRQAAERRQSRGNHACCLPKAGAEPGCVWPPLLLLHCMTPVGPRWEPANHERLSSDIRLASWVRTLWSCWSIVYLTSRNCTSQLDLTWKHVRQSNVSLLLLLGTLFILYLKRKNLTYILLGRNINFF